MASETQTQSANFNRPPRIQFPNLRDAQVEIPAPPTIPKEPDQNLILTLTPILGIGLMAFFFLVRSIGNGLDAICFGLPMVMMAGITASGTMYAMRFRKKQHQRQVWEAELSYIRLLDQKRVTLQAANDAQMGILLHNFSPPETWIDIALTRDTRLWERRPGDADFGTFRIGVGRTPSLIHINEPKANLEDKLVEQAQRTADDYRFLTNAPLIASLVEDSSIGVCGPRSIALKAVRAMICNMAVTHSPNDLQIYVIAPQAQAEVWRWVEWLPHCSLSQQGGSPDLVAFETAAIRNLIGNFSQLVDDRRAKASPDAGPYLLVVIDGPSLISSESIYPLLLSQGKSFGASALCLVNTLESVPSECGSVIELMEDERFRFARTGHQGIDLDGTQMDGLSFQNAEHIARALASVVIQTVGTSGRIPRRVDFLNMVGVTHTEELKMVLNQRWRRPIPEGVLPFPISIGRESLTVDTLLQLDEKNHGPHGVLAGTTGSGKSELLQSLVCSLVLEHDPRLLSLLLIDFKGGATFNIFNGLPHVVGTITNLDQERVSRALEALRAEIQWRQQFLTDQRVADITQYHKYRASTVNRILDPHYQPLPHLFIIVDEFAQLAKEMPDFLRELVRTVQVGRSLGLHLILGTQSPMDVITDEMNANLQFRICLRVQNIEASRAMLRRPDAAYLPAKWPGRGFFQVGEQGVFKQFQTAYVGGEYMPDAQETEQVDETLLEIVAVDGARTKLYPPRPAAVAEAEEPATQLYDEVFIPVEPYTVARAVSETISTYARQGNVPWNKPLLLPPLEETLTLATPWSLCNLKGWDGTDWQSPGLNHLKEPVPLASAPIGIIDDIYRRTQHPLWINLASDPNNQDISRKDGHVLIMGAPGTGKTTALRTLAMSLAKLTPPDALHIYCLSLTGSGLVELSELPHAERAILINEPERIRRLFGRLIQLLNERQTSKHSNHQPLVLLLLDQFEQFRDNFRDQYMPDFERLIAEGRSVGICVAFTANTPTAVPERLRSLVEQRVCLQLGGNDGIDYMLAVGRVPANLRDVTLPNGRGFVAETPPLLAQIALPISDSAKDQINYLKPMHEEILRMKEAYAKLHPDAPQAPAPIMELPKQISLGSLPRTRAEQRDGNRVVTALGRFDDDALTPFFLDWMEAGPHYLVVGPPGSGKTTLLQSAAIAAAQAYSPQQVRFLLVDFNGRSLRGLDDLKHVIRRVTDVVDFKFELVNLRSELSEFYAQVLKHEGNVRELGLPTTVIMIDDYDATSETLSAHPDILEQLRDHVRLHSELGVHIWLAGYMERASDPLIKQILLRRTGFALVNKDSVQKLNLRSSSISSDAMPPGRSFIPLGGQLFTVQTGSIDDLPNTVKTINDYWRKSKRAVWQHPATDEQIRESTANSLGRSTQTVTAVGSTSTSSLSLDIDTAGLIEDLLGKRGKE